MAKSENEKLKEKLFSKNESAWLHEDNQKAFDFSEGYKDFLEKSKTERLCAENIIDTLEKNGFKDITQKEELKPGEKVYKNIKGKSVIACIVGEKPEEIKLVASHIDCPRLDLKPHPLYEDSNLAMLQSHYYGGIKKYHWVNVPLAMHGVAYTKEGKKIQIQIGEKEDEPKFIIPDLLPHLAKEQMKKEASKVVEGEELNIVFANQPIKDEKIEEKVKLAVMKKLNTDYGLVEDDFATAEIEFVPAGNAMDIGLDSSMISAYGQDDRACVYTSLKAFTESKPRETAFAAFVDKEEVGSVGDTSAESNMLLNFTREYATKAGLETVPEKLLEKAKAVSADGTVGMDPNFKDVNDPQNVSYLGGGVSIEKYGGGGGKYFTNDAHAEYMQYVREILQANKIPWQTGELGKIDIGGGGTIAMFLSRYGMDTVDAGPCILGMHSTNEVTSKMDIYACYLFYRAFYSN